MLGAFSQSMFWTFYTSALKPADQNHVENQLVESYSEN